MKWSLDHVLTWGYMILLLTVEDQLNKPLLVLAANG
jgi:hypothetical protein